ncbi:hypothetical protein C0Q70_08607 [Pomacea canaliculata]|uniref:Uncharacterized protein n=1 Tax=Pomacea canaliculata TaxID=400727 RepID=A0A2T7PIA8_POMCA|nr:hypothetical protein C0Q70_08607 [Pomacea canaliculata]
MYPPPKPTYTFDELTWSKPAEVLGSHIGVITGGTSSNTSLDKEVPALLHAKYRQRQLWVLETVYWSLVESILTFNMAASYGHLLVKDKARLASHPPGQ